VSAPALEQPGKTVKVDIVVVEELRAILPGRGNGSEDLVVIDRTDKLMRETIQVSNYIIHFPEVQGRLGDILALSTVRVDVFPDDLFSHGGCLPGLFLRTRRTLSYGQPSKGSSSSEPTMTWTQSLS